MSQLYLIPERVFVYKSTQGQEGDSSRLLSPDTNTSFANTKLEFLYYMTNTSFNNLDVLLVDKDADREVSVWNSVYLTADKEAEWLYACIDLDSLPETCMYINSFIKYSS